MMKKLKCGIHFGDTSDEDDTDVVTIKTFDPEKNDVMMLPFSVKLITPYLMNRFPDLALFLRYDLRNFPNVKHEENAPYPYPFLEVYNLKGLLLHEVDLSCRTRAELNALLEEYQQLPKYSQRWLTPPQRPSLLPSPDLGHQYQPWATPDPGFLLQQRQSDISSVKTDFSVDSPDTQLTE